MGRVIFFLMVEHYLEQPTIWLFLHSIIILSELIGSEKGIFFRLALRARHDYALLNHTSSKRTWHWWFKKKERFFSGSRSALAMIMFCLITHSKKTWRFKKKDFFFRFALRAHHDNFVSNQHSERTCSLTIKKGFFSGSRYALALIIFCLYYTLWKGFFLLEFDLTFY